MATIANLQIDLSARTARFSEGIQRAQQRIEQFRQRTEVLSQALQRASAVAQRASLAYGALSGALTLLARRGGQYASTIATVVGQTGLAAERVQELAFAAGQANADLATLQSGLRAFVRRTAEAARGNQSFLSGFERLGFTQRDVMAGLQDIDVFLLRVADRVAELGTTAEQSAVLMTIMGDAGRRLVPFMAQGSAGIQEMAQRARELGLVMSERQIERLSAFNDRMDILGQRFEAVGREIGYMFLPAIETVVGLVEDGITAFQNIDPVLRAHAVRWTVVVGAVLGTVSVLGVLGRAISGAGAALSIFGRLVTLAFSPLFLKLALAGAAIYAFWQAWEKDWLGIRSTAEAAWEAIEPIVKTIGESLKATWEWVLDVAPDLWDWVKNTVEKIGDAISTAWSWTTGHVSEFIEWVRETAAPWIGHSIETVWDWTVSATGLAYEWVRDNALPFINRVGETFKTTWDWTVEMGGRFFGWLKDTAWPHLVSVTSTLWNWTVDFFGTFFHWLRETAWPWLDETAKTTWDWAVGTVSRFLDWIREEAAPWIGETVSTAWSWTLGSVDAFITWIRDTATPWINNSVKTTWDWVINVPGWWNKFLDWLTGRSSDTAVVPALQRIERATGFPGMASILEAIYRAEGGAAARVPFGMTGFEELGRRFEREINQQRFEQILAATGIEEGSEEFFAAAAAVSVLHYWDTFKAQFPEIGERTFAELAPEMQRLFIEHLGRGFSPPGAHPLNVNWVPNVIGILGIPGYRSGTPWTGWGPTDEIAGVVHRREAVIPWHVLREGPGAVLEFLGAPGFQRGLPQPVAMLSAGDGYAVLPQAEVDPGLIAQLIEAIVSGLESREIIDAETAQALRDLFGHLTSIVGSLSDRAQELWESLGRADERLEEALAQAAKFRDGLEKLSDLAAQARAAAEARIARLDDLVEIEALVAHATGEAFDETRFRAQELSKAIIQTARAMFEAGESVETVAATIAPWVEQLEPLQRQIRLQDAANAALEGFVNQLSDGNRLLGDFLRYLRWDGGRLRFDMGGLWTWAAGLVGQILGGLLGGTGYSPAINPRTFAAPNPLGIGGLAAAIRERRELEQLIPKLEAQLRQARRTLESSNWFERTFNPRLIARREASVRAAEESLQNALRALEAFELREYLGFDAESIARTVEAGFDMADLSRLSQSLEYTIRDALVRAWVASDEMVRLQEQFGNLLDQVVEEFIQHGDLRAGALDQLRTVITAMEERGEAFAEVLERLGFTSERLNDSFSRMVRNIPQGYRVERTLFEVAPPRIPALAAGGIVTRPTVALIGEAGPEAVVPLGSGFGTINIRIERMEVADGRDFGRKLDEELRRRGLVRAGNVTAAWGGRR